MYILQNRLFISLKVYLLERNNEQMSGLRPFIFFVVPLITKIKGLTPLVEDIFMYRMSICYQGRSPNIFVTTTSNGLIRGVALQS